MAGGGVIAAVTGGNVAFQSFLFGMQFTRFIYHPGTLLALVLPLHFALVMHAMYLAGRR